MHKALAAEINSWIAESDELIANNCNTTIALNGTICISIGSGCYYQNLINIEITKDNVICSTWLKLGAPIIIDLSCPNSFDTMKHFIVSIVRRTI